MSSPREKPPHATSKALRRLAIRPAVPEDVLRLLILEQAAPLAAHWSESQYGQIFQTDAPSRIALVATQKQPTNRRDDILGFAVGRITAGECELENIVVDSCFQKRGVGSRLLTAFIAAARANHVSRIFLEVRASNSAAIALYERCNFVVTGRRPSYYADPVEAALLYALEI